jgi:hypothetical protein
VAVAVLVVLAVQVAAVQVRAGVAGTAGTANTGGGGGAGGGGGSAFDGGAGGSGVVILRYLTADATITIGAGLTGSTTTEAVTHNCNHYCWLRKCELGIMAHYATINEQQQCCCQSKHRR